MLNICDCVAQYIVDMINACNTVCCGCYSNSALHLSSIIQTLNSLADAELYNLTSTPMPGKVQTHNGTYVGS